MPISSDELKTYALASQQVSRGSTDLSNTSDAKIINNRKFI